jgi:hypothetical protein
MNDDLPALLAAHEVVILEGCDGTGKTALAAALAARYSYPVIHSGRTPDGTDLSARYRALLSTQGRLVLDRSFISELVYGPVDHGRSRLTLPDATSLTRLVAERGGVLVHLTGHPGIITTRLSARDGSAPASSRIRALIEGYHSVFAALQGTAPIITADTTVTTLPPWHVLLPGHRWAGCGTAAQRS